MIRLMFMALALALLSGCVTESTRNPRAADREKQVQTLVDLGVGYLRNGEYARAKENLNRALDLNARSPIAHNTLALVFQVEQEYALAEEHFRLALRYDPNFTRARNNYGAFLFSRARFLEAINQLKLASEDQFYPARPAVFENLGVAYLRVSDRQPAEASFERAIALNPDQARALLELAAIRFGQQRYVEARELYRRFENVSQHNARSLLLCVKLSRVFSAADEEASCALVLRNIFPASEEYREYREMIGR